MNYKFKIKDAGFTLIEIMVAVAIFTIIMVVGVSALLNTNTIHKVSQNQRSLYDNLNFMMEDMSRNIRLGYSYHCFASGDTITGDETPLDCTSGSSAISIEGLNGITDGTGTDQIIYKVDVDLNNEYKLFKSIDGGGSFSNVTPSDIKITNPAPFTVTGAASIGEQPIVLIRLSGTTNYKGIETPFNLQTAVTQRAQDS